MRPQPDSLFLFLSLFGRDAARRRPHCSGEAAAISLFHCDSRKDVNKAIDEKTFLLRSILGTIHCVVLDAVKSRFEVRILLPNWEYVQ